MINVICKLCLGKKIVLLMEEGKIFEEYCKLCLPSCPRCNLTNCPAASDWSNSCKLDE